MHTRIKKHRVKRVKPPRPIPPPVPPRPKRSDLKSIYRGLITTNKSQRVDTLVKAMHWYEELIAYLRYKAKFTLAQDRAEAAAEKYRLSGQRSNKDEHKEEAYKEAIRSYEKLSRKYHVPKLGTYASKFSHVRFKIEKSHRRMAHKFTDYLNLIDDALRPVNIEGLRLHLSVDKLRSDYIISPTGNVTFNRKFLEESRRTSRELGLLPGFKMLFPALTQAASQTMEVDAKHFRTGRYVISPERRYTALCNMIENLIRYYVAADAPKKLVRRVPRESDEKTSAA